MIEILDEHEFQQAIEEICKSCVFNECENCSTYKYKMKNLVNDFERFKVV